MQTIRTAAEVNAGTRKVCLGIGFFDGLHLGHQQILRQTVAEARANDALAMALTFDRHPNSVVAPDRVPPLIYSLPQRLRALEAAGLDTLLLVHFDEAFSRQTGEVFVRGLARDLPGLHSVWVGASFAFGYRRGGNVALLQSLGDQLGFAVHGLSPVSLEGEAVSSTRIRQAIQSGNLEAASQMLGRPYSLAGIVVPGDGVGRELGFPTANLDFSGLALPPEGVYAVRAQVAGRQHRAVMNLGRRPTLRHAVPELRLEVHLLDFSAELYGQEIEVVFVEKLREEKKFHSLNELKAQIASDIERARQLLG